eukprot:TRINITY_DN12124_c0_g1_i1.p2 TRINITY_DN12124_c0_g1~~TRINITY_DN12124_c0_g1_i1.p2  ORF type:complete len:704 (+),score=153.71 TRINITY_DN12124_c0_g1_i1:2789-4900(+)
MLSSSLRRAAKGFQRHAQTASYSGLIRLSEEVKTALTEKTAIVGLESTIISHGMPYPVNIETAMSVEAIVRENRAVPATVAVMNGRICIGLTQQEFEQLGDPDANVAKVSRRNLADVIQNQGLGSTTVAATMMACSMVGIDIFATGGIGGVHRYGQDTMDISADLTELGRTRVGVVCSGVKSILDIPRTLEVLETQGVLVATVTEYTDQKTTEFPAFFSRRSGCQSDVAMIPEECAGVMIMQKELDINTGCVFACPIPKEHEIQVTDVIQEQLDKAEALGIRGKNVTPHLLAAINEATQGRSLKANIALIQNNAKIAAKIAGDIEWRRGHAYDTECYHPDDLRSCAPSPPSTPDDDAPKIKVLGGATQDIIAQATDELVKHSTSYGKVTTTHGGVGRNIAQALAQLGMNTTFYTRLGDDAAGRDIADRLTDLGVTVESPPDLSNTGTATYNAHLQADGSLEQAIADMDIFKNLYATSMTFDSNDAAIVIDGNVTALLGDDSDAPDPKDEEKLKKLFLKCRAATAAVWLEPASVARAKQLRHFVQHLGPAFISPDVYELQALIPEVEDSVKDYILEPWSYNRPLDAEGFLYHAQDELHGGLALNDIALIITLGKDGVIAPIPAHLDKIYNGEPVRPGIEYHHYPAVYLRNVRNVTGAGDSLAAGMLASMALGKFDTSVQAGLEAAELSIASEEAISPNLSPSIL